MQDLLAAWHDQRLCTSAERRRHRPQGRALRRGGNVAAASRPSPPMLPLAMQRFRQPPKRTLRPCSTAPTRDPRPPWAKATTPWYWPAAIGRPMAVTRASPRFRAGHFLVARLGAPASGPETLPFAHISPDGRPRLWRRFVDDAALADALALLEPDPVGASLAYRRRGLRCVRCRRPLTHPDSLERGMGPDCARKLARATAAADTVAHPTGAATR